MILFFLPFLVSMSAIQTDLTEIRMEFSKIQHNQDIRTFYQTMHHSANETPTLAAYQGVASCMMAKAAINPLEKLGLFKQGKKMIDQAVLHEPNNMEIRLLRNLIQSEAPTFLNYHCNQVEDRDLIEAQLFAQSTQSTWTIYQLFIQNEMALRSTNNHK